YVEARVVWSGIPVTLIDTAGDREAEAGLERRGVELGRARAARADVVVTVRDATLGGAPGPAFEAWNKCDLAAPPVGALAVSARTGAGLEALRAAVLERTLGAAGEGSDDALVTTERQRGLLAAAAAAADGASFAALEGRPHELVALELRAAARQLGLITGDD